VLLATRSRVLALRQSAAKEGPRILAQVLATWEPDVDLRAVESCTSELVTDALRHEAVLSIWSSNTGPTACG
jgi:hypothetical protein